MEVSSWKCFIRLLFLHQIRPTVPCLKDNDIVCHHIPRISTSYGQGNVLDNGSIAACS